jgi:hypothetical protein
VTSTFDLRPRGDREAELLLHCARVSVEPERAARIRELADGGAHWPRLLALAERNGLRPLLYWHLNRLCAASVPTSTFEFLRDYFQKNSAFSLLLTGELLQLLALLKDHGIEAVPYKGPALAVRLYGHVALRQFCDIDILVREHDVWRAGELIEGRGFQPQFVIPERWRATYIRQSYVQLFRRDAGRTLVELHWGIAPAFFAVPFDVQAMWRRLEPLALQGTTVPLPSTEDLLLMLCVHGSRHVWDKLEGVCCLAALLQGKEDLDWRDVWQKAGEMRCRRMLALGLLLAHGLFDIPLPGVAESASRSPSLRSLAEATAQRFYDEEVQPRTFVRSAAIHLRLKDSYIDRARYCARVALTPTPDDWAAVRLHGRLSFAYSLVRAGRIARKHFNHQAAGGWQ